MGFLGNTIDEIAVVKAGIFKKSRPALIGVDTPQDLLQREAENRGTVAFRIQDIIAQNNALFATLLNLYTQQEYFTPVDYDFANAQLATAAVILLHQHHHWEAPSEPLLSHLLLRPPCRWEVRIPAARPDVRVVMDVAHNAPAIAALLQRAAACFPSQTASVVYGASRDKDIRQCIGHIGRFIQLPDSIFFIQVRGVFIVCNAPQSSNYRSVPPSTLASTYHELFGQNVPEANYVCESTSNRISTIVDRAVAASPSNGVVLIFGSMYLMPAVRAALGIHEPW